MYCNDWTDDEADSSWWIPVALRVAVSRNSRLLNCDFLPVTYCDDEADSSWRVPVALQVAVSRHSRSSVCYVLPVTCYAGGMSQQQSTAFGATACCVQQALRSMCRLY
jgi:hypothetical protein